MTARTQLHQRFPPTKADWWSRLFVAVLFAFHLNYIPVHLATAAHGEGLLESAAEAAFHHHHDAHDDAGHSHDTGHHAPHPASDHALTLTTQTQASSNVAPVVFLQPADASVLLREPEAQPPLPVLERIWPPGESPPDPLQPRAPPLA